MQIFSFLFERHLEKTVLAAAVGLSVVMLTRGEDSKVAAARAVSSFLFYPSERAGRYFDSLERLQEENRALRRLVVSLSHEKELLHQFRDERNRLRELLGFRRDEFYEFLPCEVIGRSASRYHNSITVDRGVDAGVRPGMPWSATAGWSGA